MLLEISSQSIHAVATDGHRLALNTIDATVKESNKRQIIIPRKGVTELMRILDDDESNVTITVSSNHIRAETENTIFTSKLIDGRFPDYERVIPRTGSKIVLVDRDELRAALSRASILCNEKFRGIRFELRKNLLRILANNPEQEAAEDEIAIEYTDTDIDIAFNVNYLIDILNILKPGPVRFTFVDANSSMLIEEPDNDGDSLFVVMPMKL